MFNIKKYNEINDFLKKSSNSAKIVAISKNHPLKSVLEAINEGVYIFGENRVQEAHEKFQKLKLDNTKIELHLTGPLQSNKVKPAIQLFDVFHTFFGIAGLCLLGYFTQPSTEMIHSQIDPTFALPVDVVISFQCKST